MKPSILSDINYCHPSTAICKFTNGGNLDHKQSGTMDMLPLRVFYNPYSVATFLALVDVTSHFKVTMDTNNKPTIFIHTGLYYVLKFYQFFKGLYYFDTSVPTVFNPSVKACYSLTTFQEHKKCFHRSEIDGSDSARILQRDIWFPSSMKFKIIVNVNQLQNFPVTVSDVDTSDAIYGPKVSILKGKYVRKLPGHV